MNSEVIISPYEEWEKRVINGKVENVVYHATDWFTVFGVKSQHYVPNENAHTTIFTADELQDKVSKRTQLLKQVGEV